jgi:hypothetical protein
MSQKRRQKWEKQSVSGTCQERVRNLFSSIFAQRKYRTSANDEQTANADYALLLSNKIMSWRSNREEQKGAFRPTYKVLFTIVAFGGDGTRGGIASGTGRQTQAARCRFTKATAP